MAVIGGISIAAMDGLASPHSPSLTPPTRKRKRDEKALVELEVDVNAPEPPSKKALRKAKKWSLKSDAHPEKAINHPDERIEVVKTEPDTIERTERSGHSIWIGNLPWDTTRSTLRKFFTEKASIEDNSITRLHMPAPSQAAVAASQQRVKLQNKGFAYVDFATRKDLEAAMLLGEKLLSGRRVLIKDAKSFEGRPESKKEVVTAASKRIFVGNLGFDTTEDDLREHFGRCGEVLSVFVATFEDSGKCKGYGWVTFEDLASATNAVRGWIELKDEESENGDLEHDDKEVQRRRGKRKPHKWWVNRLKGRDLRMEFAEDQASRYKKRFGKNKESNNNAVDGQDAMKDSSGAAEATTSTDAHATESQSTAKVASDRKPKAQTDFDRKVDSQNVEPRAGPAGAPWMTGAIIASAGKKIIFD